MNTMNKDNQLAALKNNLLSLHNDESGATATEYIILLVLIACFVIGIVKTFGGTLSERFDAANKEVIEKVRFN